MFLKPFPFNSSFNPCDPLDILSDAYSIPPLHEGTKLVLCEIWIVASAAQVKQSFAGGVRRMQLHITYIEWGTVRTLNGEKASSCSPSSTSPNFLHWCAASWAMSVSERASMSHVVTVWCEKWFYPMSLFFAGIPCISTVIGRVSIRQRPSITSALTHSPQTSYIYNCPNRKDIESATCSKVCSDACRVLTVTQTV